MDPKKRSLGKFFQEEIAQPLGLELYIGLPKEIEDSRIAYIKGINHPLQFFLQIAEMPFPLPPSGSYFDEIIRDDIAYSLGLMKPFEKFEFGKNNKCYGHSGTGGSFCFADPDEQVGFGYAMNKQKYMLRDDPREKALRDAFYNCINKSLEKKS